MAFTINQFKAAVNNGTAEATTTSRFTKAIEVTKSASTQAANGFVGMMPVSNKKFNGTVKELQNVDAVNTASIMSLVKQLQDLGIPVELDPEEIQDDADAILAQYVKAKEDAKEAKKKEKADKVAAFKAKLGINNEDKPKSTGNKDNTIHKWGTVSDEVLAAAEIEEEEEEVKPKQPSGTRGRSTGNDGYDS